MADAMDVSDEPELLTTETVVEYVKELLANKSNLPLDLSAALVAREIGDGNLNYAWCVSEPGNESKAVFVKQAPDFVRCLGEDAKLTTDRIRTEISAALEFMERAPGSLPEIYHFDAASCVCVMQHLAAPHTLLQDFNIEGDITDAPSTAVAEFMGLVHGSTFSTAKASLASVSKIPRPTSVPDQRR